jgi:signal recognition particle subunit SRP9
MVYVDSWDEFVERSVQLFRADPNAVRRRNPRSPALSPRFVECARSNLSCLCACALQTRYVVKYRHCEGKLVLKVTDDREVPRVTFCSLQDLLLCC